MPNPENLIAHKMKPGETRNPNGRPKGARSRSTIVREWLESSETVNNPITGVKERLTQADIITLALLKKARAGDLQAYRELMDSAFGKVADVQTLQNPDGTGINQSPAIDYSKLSTAALEEIAAARIAPEDAKPG
jgi:hypothetical protein